MPALTRPSRPEDSELTLFRDSIGKFLDRHASADHFAQWREAGLVDRFAWRLAGAAGLLGVSVPSEYGGAGGDFRYDVALMEEVSWRGAESFSITFQNSVFAPYLTHFGTEEQKRRWLPGICSGEIITALAMTEPQTGSDLRGIRTHARESGTGYLLNGSKTFISNGQSADLILVVAKTGEVGGREDISLLLVGSGAPGVSRGRNLKKIGLEAQDTSELYFDDVYVEQADVLGGIASQGFEQMSAMLPQERLVIAIQAVAMMERAITETIAYTKSRTAFGKALHHYQNTQFVLAECAANVAAGRAYVDECVRRHCEGRLDGVEAAKVKYWTTEAQFRTIDACLQLFGGLGYMADTPIAQMFKDCRAQRIYGGTSEIMKLIVARSL